MEYKQLKEMPRFWVQYSITFFSAVDKSQVYELLNDKMISNEDLIFECLYEEDKIYCVNLEFADFLFCGFSCSDAILYMFSKKILERIEKIISEYEWNIKDISLSIECYENYFAKCYHIDTGIVGEAAEIVYKLKPDIYFSIGKDGIGRIKELREVCMKVCGIDIYDYRDCDSLLKKIKQEVKKLMKNKTENFKEIILLRYAIKYVKELSSKKIMW